MIPTFSRIPKFDCHTGGYGGPGEGDEGPSGEGFGGGSSGSGGGNEGGFGGLGIGNPGSYGGQQSVGAPGGTGGASAQAGQGTSYGPSGQPDTGIAVNTPANPNDPNYGPNSPYGGGPGSFDARATSQKINDWIESVNWGKVGKYTSYASTLLAPFAGPMYAGSLAFTGLLGTMTEQAAKSGGVKGSGTGRADIGEGQGLLGKLESVSLDMNNKATPKPISLSAINTRSVLPSISPMQTPTWNQEGLF